MAEPKTLALEPLTPDNAALFGWMLGKPLPLEAGAVAFSNAATDFWHEHVFDPGADGETEVLWVNYRNNDPLISSLELHKLTQQAVVPLTGTITQILALEKSDGTPDLDTLRAVTLSPGIGLCMNANVWHATRSAGSTRLMLTRRSTTADLVGHLNSDGGTKPLAETALATIEAVTLG
jgi:ureidoglycolate lyase